MLMWEVTDLARKIVEGKFRDFDEQLQRDIERILAEAAQRGMATSGPTLRNIRDRCVEELERRAAVAWQELRRVIETVNEPISESHAADLKNEVLFRLIPVNQFLTDILHKKASDMGLANTAAGQSLVPQYPFTDADERVRADIGNEIDLYLLSLKNEKKEVFSSTESQTLPRESARTNQSETVANPQKVFVVHGRNLQARDAMFTFLRSLGLQPIEWAQAVRATGQTAPYVGEILETAFSVAQAVVVLMTPDDVACLQEPFRLSDDPPHETQLTPQARPNVLFEAGMAMGRRPERTILVELGRLRPFSDVGGRYVIKLNSSPQKRRELAQHLEMAGCPVDLTGTDWLTTGDFSINSSAEIGATETAPQTPARSDLTREDALILKLTCEKAIQDNNFIVIDPQYIWEQVQPLDVTQDQFTESRQALDEKGYIKDATYHFSITPYGFETYARMYLKDYESLVKAVALEAISSENVTNKQISATLSQPEAIVDHILEILEQQGHLKALKASGGLIIVHHVSATLKRMVREQQTV